MNKIKELRKEYKITQKDLALALDIPYRTIQRWENGETTINKNKAQLIADYFGVSVAYLLGYSDFISETDFIKSVEKTNFFDDGNLLTDKEKDFFIDYNLVFNIGLLQHYYKETDILLNNILGAYIEKDKKGILTDDELSQISTLLNFLTQQPNETTEGISFLKEVLLVIKEKYKL